ncbi:MAG: MopE-related protein [Candidatus Woesearchaeota archaeon]
MNKRVLYLFFLLFILGMLSIFIIPYVSAATAVAGDEGSGGGGTCIPTTCTALGKTCGSWSDGCSATLNCGTCNSGYTCTSGQCVADATSCTTTGCSNGYICDLWGGVFASPYCSCPSGTVQITHYDYTLNRTIIDRTYTGYQGCSVEVSPGVWTQIQCVNTQTDSQNCGWCGNACSSGLSCVSGNCQCPTGQTLCNGACVGTVSDPANCGRCGNVCYAPNTKCYSGSCVQCIKAIFDCPDGPYECINNRCVLRCESPNFCGPVNSLNTDSDEDRKANCVGSDWCLSCINGYANCNANSGCETDITTTSNCGSCGNVCTASNRCPAGTSTLFYISPTCSGTCGTVSTGSSPCASSSYCSNNIYYIQPGVCNGLGTACALGIAQAQPRLGETKSCIDSSTLRTTTYNTCDANGYIGTSNDVNCPVVYGAGWTCQVVFGVPQCKRPQTFWWKMDSDGDGHYVGSAVESSTSPGTGYVVVSSQNVLSDDCNDNNAAIYPGATELCNGVDDNCVNGADETFALGEVCSSPANNCGKTSLGNTVCNTAQTGVTCNAQKPADASPAPNTPYTSPANNCGATNTGVYVCNADKISTSGNVQKPVDASPAPNTACTSAPNNLGATASGYYQCSADKLSTYCNAVKPADGCSGTPPTTSCGTCGTMTALCSGTIWTYTGASCSSTGTTQPQSCLAVSGCSGSLTQTCTLQGSNYNWVSGSCSSLLNYCAGTCIAAACCTLNSESCNGADDNCNGIIDDPWKSGSPKLGDSYTSPANSCDAKNSGTWVCNNDGSGITGSVAAPANPSPAPNTACTSSANSCGATNTGTYLCAANGLSTSCSAFAPPNPSLAPGTVCTSLPNNLGATAQGQFQCSADKLSTYCDAITPAPGCTGSAPTTSCGTCGTITALCSGTTWTYTGATCSATGNTQPQSCLAASGCSGSLTQTCTLQGSNYNWVSGSCSSLLNYCAGQCTNQSCCSLLSESCNGADDNCNGIIDDPWKAPANPKLTDVCTATNICGTNTGAQVCTVDGTGITCSVTPPVMPLNYGTPCNSTPNNCGTTTPGTIKCDGTCSATKPLDVASCCAGTPASRSCTDPNCGTQTQLCSGSVWTYTGASCAGTGATTTQPCTINSCSGTQSRNCQLSGLWTGWGTCVATNPQQETCNGVDDNCDSKIDNELSLISRSCTVGNGSCTRTGTQTQVCNGISGLGWGVCSVTPGTPTAETCNNIDDNCDGTVDEWPTCNICGDNRLGGSEQCDDGNTVSGDGCSATCRTEGDGSCNSLCGLLFPACQSGFSCEWSGIVQRCRNTACSTDSTCGCCTQSGCNDNNGCTTDVCTTGVGCSNAARTGASCGTNPLACSENLAVIKNYACSATGSCDDALASDTTTNCGNTNYCSGFTNTCVACASNTANCDQANADCESHLLTDMNNCGTCGNKCGASQTCSAGSCVTPGTWYRDVDGDGYGTPANSVLNLTQPAGYANNPADCNDNNFAIKPTATEYCDTIDQNCNGLIDETCDKDGDMYADPTLACVGSFRAGNGLIYGCATNGLDCNDNSATTYPNAPEICGVRGGNGIKENCAASVADVGCSICGDKTINTPNGLGVNEECDYGSWCMTNLGVKTVCSQDTDCAGIGDGLCLPRDSVNCSAQCMSTGCAITGLSITPIDCQDRAIDEKICTTGNTLNISIQFSGADCAKANIVQIDYHDQNRTCMITTTSTQILGITKSFFTGGNGTYVFTYVFPTIPSSCSGAPLKQAEAGLYTGNIANMQTTWIQRTNSIAPFPGISPTVILYDASQLCTATCPEAAILANELGTYTDIATAVKTNPAAKQKFMNFLKNENCFTRSAQKLRNAYCGFEKNTATNVITYKTNTTVKIGLPSLKEIEASCTILYPIGAAPTISVSAKGGSGTYHYAYTFGDGKTVNSTTSTATIPNATQTTGGYEPRVIITDSKRNTREIVCPKINITSTDSSSRGYCGDGKLNDGEYCDYANTTMVSGGKNGALLINSREPGKTSCAQLFSTSNYWNEPNGQTGSAGAAIARCNDQCQVQCQLYVSGTNTTIVTKSWNGIMP